MSLKPIHFLAVCAVGFAFGATAFLMKPHLKSPSPPRNPSSQLASKWAGKHSSPFQIQISAPNGVPTNEKADLELIATVNVQQAFNEDIEFNWILPPGVDLVDGDLQDSISGLQAGQSFERRLVVQGFTKGDASQIVVLQVSTEDNGVRIGSAGVFKEQPEAAVAAGLSASPKKNQPLPKSIQQ